LIHGIDTLHSLFTACQEHPMPTTARVFMNGRSQALRLPAKMRLHTPEVRIEQIGNALWVQPHGAATTDMGQWLQAFYATTEQLPPDFLADRTDPPAQERDWS
jgi:antitoxin VapB